jgi:hypothetical protein
MQCNSILFNKDKPEVRLNSQVHQAKVHQVEVEGRPLKAAEQVLITSKPKLLLETL